MFPDNKIVAKFSLSHTIALYVIGEGISIYFTRGIIDDLLKSGLPYSMYFAETTATQVKKQIDLTEVLVPNT